MTGLYHHILRTHQWIYQNTDGYLGHRLLFGNPTLLLPPPAAAPACPAPPRSPTPATATST